MLYTAIANIGAPVSDVPYYLSDAVMLSHGLFQFNIVTYSALYPHIFPNTVNLIHVI